MEKFISNNKLFYNKYKDSFTIDYYDVKMRELFVIIRDLIHKGYKLKTHPLSGSIKPKETEFKTVLVEEGSQLDLDSLSLIENAILTLDKFTDRGYNDPSMLEDLMLVDLTLIESILSRDQLK